MKADKQFAAGKASPVQGDTRPPDQQIKELEEQIGQAERKIADVNKSRPRLEQWIRMSLQGDLYDARNYYKRELLWLIDECGLQLVEFPPALSDVISPVTHVGKNGKAPIYTGINYAVRFKADLEALVTFLVAFQQRPRMHRVKALTIERTDPGAGQTLNVQMTFEALVIHDADQKPQKKFGLELARLSVIDAVAGMQKVPPGLGGFVAWLGPSGEFIPALIRPMEERRYADMAFRNIFVGRIPPGLPIREASAHKVHATRLISLESDVGQEQVQHSLDELRRKKSQCDKQLKDLETEIKYLEALREWIENAYSWLDELYDLTARSPFEFKGFRITKVNAGPLAPEAQEDSFRARARMTICGVIDANLQQKKKVQDLMDMINKDKYCRCSYTLLKLINQGEFEFALEVDLMHRSQHMYLMRLVIPGAKRFR
ncbi:MAG TPA: hypothetical protein VE988_20505 [Gemmataceae bacterium]|nr:hypothetical protein [Gemmataceae bacterium]